MFIIIHIIIVIFIVTIVIIIQRRVIRLCTAQGYLAGQFLVAHRFLWDDVNPIRNSEGHRPWVIVKEKKAYRCVDARDTSDRYGSSALWWQFRADCFQESYGVVRHGGPAELQSIVTREI